MDVRPRMTISVCSDVLGDKLVVISNNQERKRIIAIVCVPTFLGIIIHAYGL